MNKDIHQPSAFDWVTSGRVAGMEIQFFRSALSARNRGYPITRQRRAHVLWPWWRRGMAGELLTFSQGAVWDLLSPRLCTPILGYGDNYPTRRGIRFCYLDRSSLSSSFLTNLMPTGTCSQV